MTQDIDDILSVLLLASWGDLQNRDGQIMLDIVPLLETVDDLKNGPDIIKSLIENDHYSDHLTVRNNRQTVMIGYSDSNKDSGIASARWALQEAQIALVKTAATHKFDLFLFHGRGGTISRGGGKTNAAVMGSPPGTINGYLRVTEQGEIINEKYGLRGIALRTLEQATSSVALASAAPQYQKTDMPEWQTLMQLIAEKSQKKISAFIAS
jgi:phosphoenolpyruvate carboxylase